MLEMLSHAVECDLCGFIRGIAVGPGTDGREAYGARAVLLGQFQALPIATGELRRFAVPSIVVNRSDRMNHVLRWKRAGRGYNRAAGGTTAGASADFVQLAHDGRPTRAMDGAIYSTAPAQPRIGCIDNGVDADFGDVADDQTEFLPVWEINLHKSMVPRGAADSDGTENSRARAGYSRS